MNIKKLIWILPLASLLLTACNTEKGKKANGNQAQYKTLTVERVALIKVEVRLVGGIVHAARRPLCQRSHQV